MKKSIIALCSCCYFASPSPLAAMSMAFDKFDTHIEEYLIKPSPETDLLDLYDLLRQTNVNKPVVYRLLEQQLINAFNLFNTYCNNKLINVQDMVQAQNAYNVLRENIIAIPTVEGLLSDEISDFQQLLFMLASEKAKDFLVITSGSIENAIARKIFNLARIIAHPHEPGYQDSFDAFVLFYYAKLIVKAIDLIDGTAKVDYAYIVQNSNNLLYKQRGIYREKLVQAQKNFHILIIATATKTHA
ncbi:MAG: hypothetical protein WC365_06135 [Candidatus Babeliales bacterium]|jgi:hypothetical protein